MLFCIDTSTEIGGQMEERIYRCQAEIRLLQERYEFDDDDTDEEDVT